MTGAKHRLPLTALFAGLVAVLLISGCSTPAAAPQPQVSPSVAKVSFEPGAGAKGVSPTSGVSAKIDRGKFTTIELKNPDGEQVKGELAPDGKSWHSTEALGYGKTYTWSGQAIGDDGKKFDVQGSFETVRPKSVIHATINPTDHALVGVAMPISVKFDEPVKDKAAVERALQVQTSTPVEGSWGWLNDKQVDYRPKEYWPANTHIVVNAKLYGVALGGGAYGQADLTTDFNIGRSQIVKGDVRTHQMVVVRDGQQVASYPASYGLDNDPGRNTPNGIYVIMAKDPVEIMDNPKYGYKNVRKTFAARFSNDGEFIHENQDNFAALGKVNNTHGCINLSAADAQAYYNSALIGDPVEITGAMTNMPPIHDVYDWQIPWDQWKAKSAL